MVTFGFGYRSFGYEIVYGNKIAIKIQFYFVVQVAREHKANEWISLNEVNRKTFNIYFAMLTLSSVCVCVCGS